MMSFYSFKLLGDPLKQVVFHHQVTLFPRIALICFLTLVLFLSNDLLDEYKSVCYMTPIKDLL